MTSSYTVNSGIEKPAAGDQEDAWGGTLNTNFDIIDRVLSGVGSVSLSGTTHTLTTTDGTLTDGMYRVLLFTGALGANNTITISPNDQDKLYFVVNNTTDSGSSGPYSVIVKQGSGATVTVANGAFNMVYADGAGSGAAVISLLSKDVVFGDDVSLQSDSAVLGFGADNDVTVTHNADKGLTLNSKDISGVTSINTGQIGGNRNYIYNGDTSLCQRRTSSTGIGNGNSGYWVQDRWQFYEAGAPNAVVTQSRATDVPNGFQYSLKFDCTTASGTVASADLIYLAQILEGQDLYAWKKGTADALPVTLSFWVNTTKTGTYIVRLLDADNSRHIAKSYTVSSSNTWENKTLTLAGDTTGVFDRDTAASLYVQWGLVAGSNFTSGTLATSWASSSDANMFVGQVDALDSTSNNFHVTGLQLELGETASAFQNETYAENLLKCSRYYAQRAASNAILYSANNAGGGGYIDYSHWEFKVPMRSAPTMTGHTGTQQQINVDSGGVYAAGGYASWGNDSTASAEL